MHKGERRFPELKLNVKFIRQREKIIQIMSTKYENF